MAPVRSTLTGTVITIFFPEMAASYVVPPTVREKERMWLSFPSKGLSSSFEQLLSRQHASARIPNSFFMFFDF